MNQTHHRHLITNAIHHELSQNLKEKIDITAKDGTIITLAVKDLKLERMPPEIRDLCNLKELTLYRTGISRIPEWIGGLKGLEVLNLKGNNLSSLPSSFTDLSNLRTLDISDNPIADISAILPMESLKKVNVNYTDVEKDPVLFEKLTRGRKMELSPIATLHKPYMRLWWMATQIKKLNEKFTGNARDIPPIDPDRVIGEAYKQWKNQTAGMIFRKFSRSFIGRKFILHAVSHNPLVNITSIVEMLGIPLSEYHRISEKMWDGERKAQWRAIFQYVADKENLSPAQKRVAKKNTERIFYGCPGVQAKIGVLYGIYLALGADAYCPCYELSRKYKVSASRMYENKARFAGLGCTRGRVKREARACGEGS